MPDYYKNVQFNWTKSNWSITHSVCFGLFQCVRKSTKLAAALSTSAEKAATDFMHTSSHLLAR
mgnify:CR=1 FL=1